MDRRSIAETEWKISKQERTCLRQLACGQAEYAALPIMQQHRQMWFDLKREGAKT
ncbi:MAG: hypothetical protein HZA50_10510 [Planctomycetes bacterium]|nr:hypothetical protein [Planctomycetota bacterium]